jgi:UDP-N-acetylmuramoyl-tripeptide--D-alanyl-D-alanine ligase
MLTLADVLEALVKVRPLGADEVITEAVIDSRHVIPGALFVALPGERTDGHNYVFQAFQRGALVALVQRQPEPPADVDLPVIYLDLRPGATELPPDLSRSLAPEADASQHICLWVEDTLAALQQIARFWRQRLNSLHQAGGAHQLKVIGITGSVGKSTTKELVAEVLSQRYRTLKNLGNLNNEIGLPLTLLSLTEGHERAVLEMGFYVPGEIRFLCELAQPVIGVVTNVGTVHAERAGTIETIARGKAELVEALPPAGIAILNYDDPRVRAMAAQSKARVFFYGLDPAADLWADEVESLGLEGIRFQLHYRGEVLHLRVPMIGQHSVHTALRAAAVGLVDGLTWQEIVAGLHSSTTQLRLVAVRTASGALILDDTYNASPESTLAALNLLAELDAGKGRLARRVAVLGDMLELGQYERQGHEMVGVRAAEVVSELVTVGPRAHIIAEAAKSAGLRRKAIKEFEATAQAVTYLQENLHENDIVLVKGSHGMRMDHIVAALEAQQ